MQGNIWASRSSGRGWVSDNIGQLYNFDNNTAVRTDRRYQIMDNKASDTQHCLDAGSNGQQCDASNKWRVFSFARV